MTRRATVAVVAAGLLALGGFGDPAGAASSAAAKAGRAHAARCATGSAAHRRACRRRGARVRAALRRKPPATSTTLAAPTGLAVTGTTLSSVSLGWTATPGAVRYDVLLGGAVALSSTTPAATVWGLACSTPATFTVVAVDASGTRSAPSTAVGATTMLCPVPVDGPSLRYVSTAGSDTGDGSAAAPWRTVQKAASAAPAGAVVQVAPGSYGESVTVASSGLALRSTTPGGARLRSVAVTGGGVSVDGFDIGGAPGDCVSIAPGIARVSVTADVIHDCGRDGLRVARTTGTYASDLTIRGNRIDRVGQASRYGNDLTLYADRATVEGNDLTGTPNDAIDFWGDGHVYRANVIHDLSNTLGNHDDAFQTWTGTGDGTEGHPVTNLLVERNRVVDVRGADAHCLMSEGPGHANWTIRDNVFSSIGDQCVILGSPSNGTQGIAGVRLVNNTFVAAGANNTLEVNLSSTVTLADNLFHDCRGWGGDRPYAVAATASARADFDLASGTTAPLREAHGLTGAARFADLAAGDLHLLAGSAAIDHGDAGVLVSPARAVDLDGRPTVGTVDIGAYEYQG